MSGLYIERRTFHEGPLSRDLAYHLSTRQLPGKIVVIADKPTVMLSVVSKQWQRVIRTIQRERASTLKSLRIQELTRSLTHMQRLHMTTYRPNAEASGDIVFMTIAEAVQRPPVCHTLYVTHKADKTALSAATANMPRNSLLVLY